MSFASSPNVVLYIEDSPVNVKLMEKIFSRRLPELRLVVAVDGMSGLAAITEYEPFMVLLDCHLPDISGLAIVQRLRSEGNTVPIVVITADARPELAETMLAAGAEGVLTKPFDFDVLFAHIHRHVEAAANAS